MDRSRDVPVQVLWKMESTRYHGTVQRFDEGCGMHLVIYDDGDTRWHKMGSEDWRKLSPEEDTFGFESKRRSKAPDRCQCCWPHSGSAVAGGRYRAPDNRAGAHKRPHNKVESDEEDELPISCSFNKRPHKRARTKAQEDEGDSSDQGEPEPVGCPSC